MGLFIFLLFFSILFATFCSFQSHEMVEEGRRNSRSVIDVQEGPESVIWVVQLSDLHFSVHHPERALDFKRVVGPALAMINPSLVLITGDLTDGKSKDLMTMKQNEEEWKEYNKVMKDVVEKSGLDKKVFYDLRGNHDNFGVPIVGGELDFFQKYSINGGLGRSGNVHSATLQGDEWNHVFVGFDSTMGVGLRGPTNLFGHPTDDLLADIDSELSQWDSQSIKPITKITFGHFPLSFTATTDSGRSLKDVFLKHSLSVYLCGHLHTRFGKNLKRHHICCYPSHEYFQLNMQQKNIESDKASKGCSNEVSPVKEFWEWEMGDWRKSRTMRVLAIDMGHTSFVDLDLSLGAKKTIVLPTFPIDSRFMQRVSSHHNYECQSFNTSSYGSVRALVFSEPKIASVVARIYDSFPGKLELIFEHTMKKHKGSESRGDFYSTPWNWKAFVDPSADRFWLQIEAIDIMGSSTLSQIRPFSINGLTAPLDWKWKEFYVMGCQWASLYRPMLWSIILFLFSFLIISKAFLIFSRKHYMYRCFTWDLNIRSISKCLLNFICWVSLEFSKMTLIWFATAVYLLYLMFCPWFFGQVFTESGTMGYMTPRGWMVNSPKRVHNNYIGVPDIMVIVLPHLVFVVLPAILISGAMAVEKSAYRMHYVSLSGKKEDDVKYKRNQKSKLASMMHPKNPNSCNSFCFCKGRWFRKFLLLVCLVLLWKHWSHCRSLMKAYEMNPFLHSPAYCFPIPLLLAYSVYKTTGN